MFGKDKIELIRYKAGLNIISKVLDYAMAGRSSEYEKMLWIKIQINRLLRGEYVWPPSPQKD